MKRWTGHEVRLLGTVSPSLIFTGSITIAQGSAGPHFTLIVLNNPTANPYDSFAEVTDADNIAALSGDEITITTTSVDTHQIVYKAVSSGGRPDLTITIDLAITDQTAPSLSSVVPADNATGVAVDADIVVTWGENVVAGTGVLSLKLTADDSTVDSWDIATDAGAGAGQFEIAGGAVTFHPTTDRDNSTEYYIVWPAGLVEDAAGNGVAAQASTTAYSFTTASGVAPLLVDLVAYWDLDEASGNRADGHTNAITLTDNATVTSGDGVGVGQTAALFAAANDEFLSAANALLIGPGGGTDFSVCGWVYPITFPGSLPMYWFGIGGAVAAAPDGENPFLAWLETGDFFAEVRGATTTTSRARDTTNPTLETWHFLVVTYTASDRICRLYLNNGAVKAGSALTNPVEVPDPVTLTIGRSSSQVANTKEFDGRIQAVGFWDRLLTADEITWLYNTGTAARLYADVAAYTG